MNPQAPRLYGLPKVHKEDSSSDFNLVKIHKKRRVIYSSESENSSGVSPTEPLTPDEKPPNEEAETPKSLRALRDLLDNLQMRASMFIHCSVPKIYYGARTHKQLQQVVKEFRRTAYCGDARMSILSSRDYSCIREFDKSLYKTKNDMCKECVPKKTETHSKCLYFNNKTALCHDTLPAAFDLEDLVSAGQHLKACPYYAARTMASSADIVFCPYNYLIDPFIRNSMSIDLRDEIVILDEAHNIEDICRDAATFTVTRDHVHSALQELEQLSQYAYANQDIMADVLCIIRALTNWDDWFKNQTQFVIDLPLRNGEATHTLEVEFFAETLKNHNIGREQSQVLKEHTLRIEHAIACTKSKRVDSYLSKDIQNEFISILGKEVKNNILDEIKKAIYFGILFDSTPDISHVDQMSYVIRYVHIEGDDVEVKESFLGFFPIAGKTAVELTENILTQLEVITWTHIYGLGYDNAATMAGVHGGVQAIAKEHNP
ncbi:Fanconi anemia group J protein homolog [Eumeta japonica]|uniref:Fanconi anemia group J protein homolog n=1 Tax=Eumeta variegata TaxID=151549 RepID=A0A4C1SEJ3_EUMVA|nr:Fanconi anemia group J protein homolog [Eumeta japonica]